MSLHECLRVCGGDAFRLAKRCQSKHPRCKQGFAKPSARFSLAKRSSHERHREPSHRVRARETAVACAGGGGLGIRRSNVGGAAESGRVRAGIQESGDCPPNERGTRFGRLGNYFGRLQHARV